VQYYFLSNYWISSNSKPNLNELQSLLFARYAIFSNFREFLRRIIVGKITQSHMGTAKLQTNSTSEILIAGCCSGCAGVLVCHPFDVIRTRIQISKVSRSATECFREVIQAYGVRGLYTGIMAPFFAQGIYKAVIFTTNTLVNRHVFTGQSSNYTTFSSGAIAGSLNSIIVAPVELMRTRQISSVTNGSYASLFRTLIKDGGFRGLFRGLIPAALRDGLGVGAYFLTFDLCKKFITANISIDGARSVPLGSNTPKNSNSSLLVVKLMSGSCAGIAFWVVALPIDTVKTIFESSCAKKGIISQSQEAYNIIKEGGGMVTLFRAWPVAIGRGIPSAAVTLTTFDVVSEWLVLKRQSAT
jgi:solute carrier family 25 (mitochondrial carnitine/acylcarnitine transporter), member 20/29